MKSLMEWPRQNVWAWLVAGLLPLPLIFWMKGWGYDDLYITYRYSLNIAEGAGFVYNPGEQVLSTTTPLYALVLAFFRIAGADLPVVSLQISVASLALGGLALWHLGQRWASPVAAWVGLLVYPFFPLLVTTLGSEQPFTLALVLWGTVAYAGRRYPAAAVLLALAVVSRADSGVMVMILAAHFLFVRFGRLEKSFPWAALAAGGGILLLWGIFAWNYFGSPLPATLAAKQAQGVMAISQSYWVGMGMQAQQYAGNPRYWLLLISAGAGLIFLIRRPQWLPVVLWSGAHLAAYSLLGVTRYFWYYAQLVPGLIVLVALGVEGVASGIKRWAGHTPAILVAALLVIPLVGVELLSVREIGQHPDGRLGIYQDVGEWLAANTPADAKIGTLEIGIIGYYAQRPMIDFAGLLQPEVVQVFRSDSTYDDTALWAIDHFRPYYLVLQDGILPRTEVAPLVTTACTTIHTITQDGYPAPIRILQCQWG